GGSSTPSAERPAFRCGGLLEAPDVGQPRPGDRPVRLVDDLARIVVDGVVVLAVGHAGHVSARPHLVVSATAGDEWPAPIGGIRRALPTDAGFVLGGARLGFGPDLGIKGTRQKLAVPALAQRAAEDGPNEHGCERCDTGNGSDVPPLARCRRNPSAA